MKNVFSLKNKNILITGASSGIGRNCAIAASQFGANVILIARNQKELKETYSRLKKGNHILFSQDISEYNKLEEIVRKSVEKVGRIAGFIHSAGIEMTIPLKSLKSVYYEKVISVNAISAFELARLISNREYIDEKGASFIFISSIMGMVGQAGKVAYCASKGALIGAARAMALELVYKKIRVNCILPAIIETEMSKELFEKISEESRKSIMDMHPLGLGKPEDVANACIFLLSEASRWITGTNLIVDGGYSAK